MSDLELTRLCAQAMGADLTDREGNSIPFEFNEKTKSISVYDPLHDDAQAMALVKRLRIAIGNDEGSWYCRPDYPHAEVKNSHLNRAICECVAQMQKAKT